MSVCYSLSFLPRSVKTSGRSQPQSRVWCGGNAAAIEVDEVDPRSATSGHTRRRDGRSQDTSAIRTATRSRSFEGEGCPASKGIMPSPCRAKK